MNVRAMTMLLAALLTAVGASGCGKDAPRSQGTSANAPTLPFQESPEKAWSSFQQAVADDDAEAIWAFLSNDSREWLETGEASSWLGAIRDRSEADLESIAKYARIAPKTMKQMPVPELARLLAVAEIRRNRDRIAGWECRASEVVGSTAILSLATANGPDQRLVLVKEASTWKLDVVSSRKLLDAKDMLIAR